MKKLRKPVIRKKTIRYEAKPALHAYECDQCHKVFGIDKDALLWHGDHIEMTGTFDRSPEGEGNGFRAMVCSLACADQMFWGGWATLDRYADFADVEANLARCTVKMIHADAILPQEELEKRWDEAEEATADSGEGDWISTKPMPFNCDPDPYNGPAFTVETEPTVSCPECGTSIRIRARAVKR